MSKKRLPVDPLPPHSIDAEQGVLGCCLLDTAKIQIALRAGVTSSWFYDSRHRAIFSVLADMAGNGGGDAVKVAIRLEDGGKLRGIGGHSYLSELQGRVPSAENLDYYLPTLRTNRWRRVALSAATRLGQLAQDPSIDPDVLVTDVEGVLASLRRDTDEGLPAITDAAELVEQPMTEPRELVDGVLHQGSKLVLGGGSKSFKTWALLDLALSVAYGEPWLSFQTIKGPVLYLNFELPPWSFRQRISEVARVKRIALQPRQLSVWNLRGKAAPFDVLFPKIKAEIKKAGYALIVLDPIYKLYGTTDENAAGDVARMLNAIEDLSVTTGAAVAFGAHFSKGNQAGKEAIDRISGSGVFARDPDSILVLTRHEEEEAFTLEATLRNFKPVQPFVVRWQYPLLRRDESLDPARLKRAGGRRPQHNAEEILKLLPGEGLDNKAWIDAASEIGVPERTFYRLRTELLRAARVLKSKINAKWQPVTKPA